MRVPERRGEGETYRKKNRCSTSCDNGSHCELVPGVSVPNVQNRRPFASSNGSLTRCDYCVEGVRG